MGVVLVNRLPDLLNTYLDQGLISSKRRTTFHLKTLFNGLKFDFVLLHNSVNDLDKEACVGLATNWEYQERYCSLFKKMYEMMSPNAILMACDCSSKNFFPRLGLKSPFWKSIEWHNHQPPEQWIDLLRRVSFTQPRIRWSSYNFLFTPGRILTGNRFVSYFLLSHFSLTMVKEPT